MKAKTFLAAIFMAMMLAFTSIGFVGCAPTNEDSGSGSGSGDGNYTVTFYYGFADGATYDATSKQPSEYADSLEKESKEGKKVVLTSSEKNSFNVDGYTVAGYSTNAWSQNGITADLDVYVLYAETETYTVTFKNPDGTVIKAISGLEEGESVADSDLPDTQIPVYSITATEYEGMDSSLKGFYEPYGETGTYILTAEASKTSNTVVIPRGSKFDGWNGSYANIEGDVDIVAKTTRVSKNINSTDATQARIEARELTTKLTSAKSISATSVLGEGKWFEASFVVNNTSSNDITTNFYLTAGIDDGAAKNDPNRNGTEYGNKFLLFVDGVLYTDLETLKIQEGDKWNVGTDKLWIDGLVLTPGEHTITFMNNATVKYERAYVFGFMIEYAPVA